MDTRLPACPILSVIVPVKDEEVAIAAFVTRVAAVIEALPDPAMDEIIVDSGKGFLSDLSFTVPDLPA